MARERPKDVSVVNVYPSAQGFRYTCRDAERKVVYDSTRAFRSRRHAAAEISLYFPEAKVSYEL